MASKILLDPSRAWPLSFARHHDRHLHRRPETLKYLTHVGKLAGFVATLNVIPFVDPAVGVIVFAAASILKDTARTSATCSTTASPTRASRPERHTIFRHAGILGVGT